MVCLSRRPVAHPSDEKLLFSGKEAIRNGGHVMKEGRRTDDIAPEMEREESHWVVEYADGFEEVVQHAIGRRPYFTPTSDGWRYDVTASTLLRYHAAHSLLYPVVTSPFRFMSRYAQSIADGSAAQVLERIAHKTTSAESLKRWAEKALGKWTEWAKNLRELSSGTNGKGGKDKSG
ncbi:hypothetical protein HDU93_007375 [Gonapodya sp. JEL0774]|nr:hypothetical protein HDU93_007375 [Gonapodya sp. JEL0774]